MREKEFPKEGFLWDLYNPPTALLQKRLPFIMKGIDSYGREDEIRAEKLKKKREARSTKNKQAGATIWVARLRSANSGANKEREKTNEVSESGCWQGFDAGQAAA